MTCWCQRLGGQLLGNRVQDVSLLKRLAQSALRADYEQLPQHVR